MTRHALLLLVTAMAGGCGAPSSRGTTTDDPGGSDPAPPATPLEAFVVMGEDVPLDRYFEVLDSLIGGVAALAADPMAEHLLVRANPWLIERLEETDYYRIKARGRTSLDPRSELALRQGDTLRIPGRDRMEALRDTLEHTTIDVNVPEFRLRILEFGAVRAAFPVRVGQNRRRFLAMAGTEVDLRTRTGRGSIVRINRDPDYTNPVDNHRYESTRRDDGIVTGLPRIPFLEPELDGLRHGQLIHPTTNPETLGRASSNGCVGTSEAAAWRIYYSAPLGTDVVIRYDREVLSAAGEKIVLPDIYDFESASRPGTENTPPLSCGPTQ